MYFKTELILGTHIYPDCCVFVRNFTHFNTPRGQTRNSVFVCNHIHIFWIVVLSAIRLLRLQTRLLW